MTLQKQCKGILDSDGCTFRKSENKGEEKEERVRRIERRKKKRYRSEVPALLNKSCFDSYTLAQPLCDDNRSLYQTFNFKLFAVASTSGMYLVMSGFSCEEPNNGLLTKSANL